MPQMKVIVRVGMCGLLGVVVCGCEWLPVPGPEVVRSPAQFDGLTQGELGAAHGYVIGVAKERFKPRPDQVDQPLLASMEAETIPVRVDPKDPIPGRNFPAADAKLKARSAKAVADGPVVAPGTETKAEIPKGSESGGGASFKTPLPSTAAATAVTADLNDDGFLTLDEMVAMARAKVPGEEIARRVEATGFVLGATGPQIRYLRAFGVPEEGLKPWMGR